MIKTRCSNLPSLYRLFESPLFDSQSSTFDIDVEQTDDGLILTAEVPGIQKDNIDIELKNDLLTISCTPPVLETEDKKYLLKERRTKPMNRSLQITDVDEQNIVANLQDGILCIKMKRAPNTKIPITVQ